MNIYKIWQEENDDYDTYDSAVVIAKNEEEAIDINPCGSGEMDWESPTKMYSGWVQSRELVKVEYMGEAKEGSLKGVIVASYNAG